MRFQVGDIVECLNSGGYKSLKEGDTYRVLYASYDMVGVQEAIPEYFNYRFKLVQSGTSSYSDSYEDIIAGQEAYSALVDR